MVYIVVPGTGSQDGMFLVCQTAADNHVKVERSFDDELDAMECCDRLNDQIEVLVVEDKVPADMLMLLDMVA